MKIFAHRGYSDKYPENTMQAFIKSNKPYVYGIELDVHLTKDKVAVIIHDETLDRTTKIKGYVKDKTYLEVKDYIPSLEEYLQFVKNTHLVTNIELKTNIFEYRGIEKIVLSLIDKYDLKNRIIISSSNHFTLKRIHKLSDIRIATLISDRIIDVIDYSKKLKMYSIHPEYHSIDKKYVKKVKEYNLELIPYTINIKKDAKKLEKLGVEYIITNDINILR